MKQYPIMTAEIRRGLPIYAFNKLDGSNIRAEWSRKNGFYKFGSRKVLIDKTHPLGEAEKLIRDARFDQAIVFFEFFGRHTEEEHDVVLFDANPYKKGILPPADFLKLVGHLDVPPVLYRGNVTQEFEQSVLNSTLDGMGFEGVVCKAKNPKRTPMPVMFKIKSRAWRERLRVTVLAMMKCIVSCYE